MISLEDLKKLKLRREIDLAYKNKMICVRSQQWDKAANFRDRERKLIKELKELKKRAMNEIKEELIRCFKESQLGLEGMLPVDAMSSDAKEALQELVEEGEVVELEYSRLSSICPGKRYGLKGEEYPMDYWELWEYRKYKENNKREDTFTYKQYLKEIQNEEGSNNNKENKS